MEEAPLIGGGTLNFIFSSNVKMALNICFQLIYCTKLDFDVLNRYEKCESCSTHIFLGARVHYDMTVGNAI